MALIESKTGWSHAEVLGRVGVCVTTLGPKGSVIEAGDAAPLDVRAAAPPGWPTRRGWATRTGPG